MHQLLSHMQAALHLQCCMPKQAPSMMTHLLLAQRHPLPFTSGLPIGHAVHAGQGIKLHHLARAEGSLAVAVDRDAPPHSCLAYWRDHVCMQQEQLHSLAEEPADTWYEAHSAALELRHPQTEGQHVYKQGAADVGAAVDSALAS